MSPFLCLAPRCERRRDNRTKVKISVLCILQVNEFLCLFHVTFHIFLSIKRSYMERDEIDCLHYKNIHVECLYYNNLKHKDLLRRRRLILL